MLHQPTPNVKLTQLYYSCIILPQIDMGENMLWWTNPRALTTTQTYIIITGSLVTTCTHTFWGRWTFTSSSFLSRQMNLLRYWWITLSKWNLNLSKFECLDMNGVKTTKKSSFQPQWMYGTILITIINNIITPIS